MKTKFAAYFIFFHLNGQREGASRIGLLRCFYLAVSARAAGLRMFGGTAKPELTKREEERGETERGMRLRKREERGRA
ncbi:hypothetical protein ANANG_G00296210 [Anguilla anguilla]|uniref:Uncharacterized protein n=1 Tax=Anguilla anguilla TaxID=7936 RepID=A0A9D3LKY9_ANGAN|nr:hypothetical protein ANANG_G00296210 [Anguilla anguilla]